MRPAGVIIADPARQADTQLKTGFERMEINAFVLQRAPQTFDEHIVHTAAATIYADPDLGSLQHGGEVEAGGLARIEDLQATETRQRYLQRHDVEPDIRRVRQPSRQQRSMSCRRSRGRFHAAIIV